MADPRKFFVPAAESYSAQHIADVTSPDGQAAVNEEFRRIQSAIRKISPQDTPPTATPTQAAAAASTPQPTASNKKLTIEHNSITVVPDVTEIINFEDSDTIQFDVQYPAPKTAKIKAKGRGNTSGSGYKARKIGEILYSVDGLIFTPEWPLTSETQGVLLCDNGIIMIRG